MSESIPVTAFFVSPSIIFQCLFCQVAITERQHGSYHVSTGSQCPNCGAYYLIDWHENPQHAHIEMREREEEDHYEETSTGVL